jgi:beta-glucosidase/6-phospho-beta-glucosidase/beta-galactosidase
MSLRSSDYAAAALRGLEDRYARPGNRASAEASGDDIAPFPTLYHWDLPQSLQDRGGWENRDTAEAFAQYAGYVAEKLSDRVKHFFTLNECWTFVELGYGTGVFAPGLKLPPDRLNQLRHHVLLAHGLAVRAIRARSPRMPMSACLSSKPRSISRQPSLPPASSMRPT